MDEAVRTVRFIVRTIAETAVEREAEFGDLDAVVGDGDFGYSLARGFEQVIEQFDGYPSNDVSAFLKSVALTISSRVGGTSGPIWGTAFLRAAAAAQGREELGPVEAALLLRAAVEGIQARGKAEIGDKTLLDALIPAIDEMERASDEGAGSGEIARRVAATARRAAEATTGLQAMRGRASYSGTRSIGSPDAGAIAVAVMAEAIAERWSGHGALDVKVVSNSGEGVDTDEEVS